MLKGTLCLTAFAIGLVVLMSGRTTGGELGKGKDDKNFDPKYANTTYVPTADEVIYKLFDMAKVNKDDDIFDLGCGDNRVCYMAAKKYGCRGVGVEINPDRIREAMDQYEKFNGGKDFKYLLS